MSGIVELFCSRRVPQVAALALVSIGFAGCSADMSTRVSQDSFSNPFASPRDATGSVPTPAVERRELPQYSRTPSPPEAAAAQPTIAAPQSYRAASIGISGGGRGLASYTPPAHPIETTGTVAPRSVAAVHGPAQGGTTIIVGTSDTLDGLAHHYKVTPAAILQANGYKGPRALSPGQQLIIPRSTAVAAAPPSAAVAAPAPAVAAPATRVVAAAPAPSFHVVNPGETLMSIAHRHHLPAAELAKANSLDASAKLKVGARLTIPSAKTAAAPATVTIAQPAAVPAVGKLAAAPVGTPQSARLAQATTSVEAAPESPVKAAEATAALPTFRWPVRGKVITSYGAKTNGKVNDGINLAVPEGTPVKAAEDGVVAYSGNELKGYGNLILVRHANGYVTAYAHASELLVKRGDTIKRGQVIAKSGQSGEVGSPQLHFEIRRGSTPVDPLQFLNGA